MCHMFTVTSPTNLGSNFIFLVVSPHFFTNLLIKTITFYSFFMVTSQGDLPTGHGMTWATWRHRRFLRSRIGVAEKPKEEIVEEEEVLIFEVRLPEISGKHGGILIPQSIRRCFEGKINEGRSIAVFYWGYSDLLALTSYASEVEGKSGFMGCCWAKWGRWSALGWQRACGRRTFIPARMCVDSKLERSIIST